MASDPTDEGQTTDDRIRRGAGRLLARGAAGLFGVVGLVGYAYLGFYELKPGEAAVILELGRYEQTVETPGLHWHWPPPFASDDIVDVSRVRRAEFGFPSDGAPSATQRLEGTVQTRDNNIVELHFVVQYRVKNAFFDRYRIADPTQTLRDAAQAAIREVIGRTSIDAVLTEQRGIVQSETREQLQGLLDAYQSGLRIDSVELKEVEPPAAVRSAFDDVISAAQDRTRKINEAEGYANEVLPQGRAVAAERKASASAYAETTVAEAEGQAGRFRALAAEYRRAPEVTSRRLYLETVEAVFARAEKVIIEPGAAQLLPLLQLGRAGSPAAGPPRPDAAVGVSGQ